MCLRPPLFGLYNVYTHPGPPPPFGVNNLQNPLTCYVASIQVCAYLLTVSNACPCSFAFFYYFFAFFAFPFHFQLPAITIH